MPTFVRNEHRARRKRITGVIRSVAARQRDPARTPRTECKPKGTKLPTETLVTGLLSSFRWVYRALAEACYEVVAAGSSAQVGRRIAMVSRNIVNYPLPMHQRTVLCESVIDQELR